MIDLQNHNLLFRSEAFKISMILKRPLTSGVRVTPPGTEKFSSKNYLPFTDHFWVPPGPPVGRITEKYHCTPAPRLSSGTNVLQPPPRQWNTNDLFYELGTSRIHCEQRVVTHKLRRSQGWKGATVRSSPVSYYLSMTSNAGAFVPSLIKILFQNHTLPLFFPPKFAVIFFVCQNWLVQILLLWSYLMYF